MDTGSSWCFFIRDSDNVMMWESEWACVRVSVCPCPCQNVCAHSYAYILMLKRYMCVWLKVYESGKKACMSARSHVCVRKGLETAQCSSGGEANLIWRFHAALEIVKSYRGISCTLLMEGTQYRNNRIRFVGATMTQMGSSAHWSTPDLTKEHWNNDTRLGDCIFTKEKAS